MVQDSSLSLGLENSHVLISGAAGQIGSVVVDAFLRAGAIVTAWDINDSDMTIKHERLSWDHVDVLNEEQVEGGFEKATKANGVIAVCVALAGLDLSFLPHHASLCDMPLSQWQRTFAVNAQGTFLTARGWLRGLKGHESIRNASLIVFGSEAAEFGVTGNSDYSASKAAIQYGFVRSLAKDVISIHPQARVNAIAPGPVETPQFHKECAGDENARWLECEATVAMRMPVPMEAVARTVLFLASEAWYITLAEMKDLRVIRGSFIGGER